MLAGLKDFFVHLLERVFGTKYERDMKRIGPIVAEINRSAEEYRNLSEEELRGMTGVFRQELADGVDLEDLLIRAFAVVKETCRRHVGRTWQVTGQDTTWEMIPYDVQIVGGIALHEGKIAEMATGEGKTLVALMPLYLNALPGKGVHLVTVNDYLARRDREWMGPILEYLGLTVGVIQHDLSPPQRRESYGCDVAYGTNNEFGFDYLRDNMAVRAQDMVQRGHFYCIIDEVDNILIDEARTPLIISGPVTSSNQNYVTMKASVERVVRAQNQLITGWMPEVEAAVEAGDPEPVAVRLLQIQRAAPKQKKFMKLVSDNPGLQKVIRKVEFEANRDKTMGEIDQELYFTVDEKTREVDLTDKGRSLVSPGDPQAFVLPDLAVEVEEVEQAEDLTPEEKVQRKEEAHRRYAARADQIHAIQQLLRAYSLYEKDVEYVVQDGKVLIVDEFTGRLMSGRRWSDGLHQAVEAKEGVTVEGENQTLATITLQNYFRLYTKRAGMTGTAETEAPEFFDIYKLDVMKIPTHRPVRRNDMNDQILRTRREKYNAIVDEVERLHNSGRPVLVGTVSVEVSETLARFFKRRGLRHNVLNAKHHQREAEIVSRAGEKGAITIATNMAGRGTDIKLGPGVLPKNDDPGAKDSEENMGLAIIGTERHESRRIDRQLRGRSGRQGDPGSSRFFLSLEDDLMRLFRSERIAGIMERLGAQEGDVIEHRWVTRGVENAQKKVEERNFSIRKRLLEYDDVMNKQREVVYGLRSQVLRGGNMRDRMTEYAEEIARGHVQPHLDPKEPLKPDVVRLIAAELELVFVHPMMADELLAEGSEEGVAGEFALDHFTRYARIAYERRENDWGEEITREVERRVMLMVIDEKWRDHLYEMDMLKEGIGLRAYGQKDPLLEYKREAFQTFEAMMDALGEEIVKRFFRISLVRQEERRPQAPPVAAPAGAQEAPRATPRLRPEHQALGMLGRPAATRTVTSATPEAREPMKAGKKVGRNDPCPCGSGQKYKKCHGAGA